jgi:hypothetical protein
MKELGRENKREVMNEIGGEVINEIKWEMMSKQSGRESNEQCRR